ncbi:MAG: hypothetical protein AAGD38_16720 [Acidobacteriota bacterium]
MTCSKIGLWSRRCDRWRFTATARSSLVLIVRSWLDVRLEIELHRRALEVKAE